jgi:molybdate transport system permease protein
VLEGLIALPLVLPPTVLGFYLLAALGDDTPLGATWTALFGQGLVFSFEGLVVASLIANLPFAVQPALRAFEGITPELREAAWVSGLGPWRTFWTVEAPLAWPGVLTGFILTFAHTMGEFGVVLMIGGSIPGETRTAALAIYDKVQAFDDTGAGVLAAALVAVSVVAIIAVQALGSRLARHDR